MSSAFPGALALLALLPLLWWLHRARNRGDPLYVASVVLFQPAKTPLDTPESKPLQQADWAWLRRALLVLALCAALAGLQRTPATQPIVVWVDGSPSLQTAEGQVTRLVRALTRLQRELASRQRADVTLRALAQPGFSTHIGSHFDVGSLAAQLPRGLPVLPQRSSLDPLAEQWVVTDGANLQLQRWLSTAPIDRVIREGAETENTAIVLLALRPSLKNPARSDVLVSVHNAGRSMARRRLDISPLDPDTGWSALTLQPGETQSVHFETGSAPLRLEARLSPADALPDDDTLTLSVPRPLTASVAVDAACGPAFGAAVKANPAILATAVSGAELLVDCSDRWRESQQARLVVRRSSNVRPVVEPAYWISRLALPEISPAVRLRTAGASLAAGPEEEAILTAGGRPLVVLRARPPRRVETILDLLDEDLVSRAEFPLLIATLLDVTAGEELLGRVAARSRAVEETVIAPALTIDGERRARFDPRARARSGSRTAQRQTTDAAAARGAVDLTSPWLAIALLVLVWETLLAARALWRSRQYYSGG